MNLVQAQAAIVNSLKTALGSGVKEVIAHGGKFENLDSLKRIALKSPVVLVSFKGFLNTGIYLGAHSTTCQWAVFLVTGNGGPHRDKDLDAIALVNNLLMAINTNDWGFAQDEPERLAGQDLSNGAIQKSGVALWGISWQQRMPISALVDVGDLADLASIHGDHYAAPGEHVGADGNDQPLASDTVVLPTL